MGVHSLYIFYSNFLNQKVIIESDSKVVIEAISGEVSFISWDVLEMIDSIRNLVAGVDSLPFAFVPRETNWVAH